MPPKRAPAVLSTSLRWHAADDLPQLVNEQLVPGRRALGAQRRVRGAPCLPGLRREVAHRGIRRRIELRVRGEEGVARGRRFGRLRSGALDEVAEFAHAL